MEMSDGGRGDRVVSVKRQRKRESVCGQSLAELPRPSEKSEGEGGGERLTLDDRIESNYAREERESLHATSGDRAAGT